MKKSVNHHWLGGLEPDPSKYFGFIYRIDCLETGHGYIGKRQYYRTKPGAKLCKSKVADRGSPRWKDSCWEPSAWEYYKGSSKYLAKFMKDNPSYTFTYTILKNCRSRGILLYSEAEEQWKCEVLVARLPDGKHKFFNHQIGGIRFRPSLEVSPETRAKIGAASRGRVWSEESKAKISISLLGHTRNLGHKVSEETRAKISKANKGNTNCLGNVHSDDSKRKIAIALAGNKNPIGCTRSAETRKRMGAAKAGVPKSGEHKAKLREANLDKNTYTFESVKTKETFRGTREELRDSLGLNILCVGRLIRGQQKSTKGWVLKESHERD